MTCDEAREAMMTAEPRELLGRGDSALSSHVTGCRACADKAKVVIAALAPLSRALNRRARRRAAMIVGIPAAAAATVIGVFIGGRRSESDNTRVGPTTAIPANVVSVDVKAGQRATVLKTSDPKVTVVWISSGGTE